MALALRGLTLCSIAWTYALPLGISFYTFQQIAFVSDVYRGKVRSFTFKTYILFKLYFPQFIAGPIVHFERVRASYERWPTFNTRSIRFALIIFAIGMTKKLIGDHFGSIANFYFPKQATLNGYEAWLAMLAFTFQIYFDFSGYSDMAVGLGRLFGVSLPFNFDSPYKSSSITEFWRRWHLTLSSWLRDYLYIPLGGNRHGVFVMYAALLTTMILGGLWHGAGWNFIWWGAAHGLALVWCRLLPFQVPRWFGVASTFVFVALTWIFFRSATFNGAIEHFVRLFNFGPDVIGIELKRIAYIVLPIDRLVERGTNRPDQIVELAALAGAILWCLFLPNSQSISLWASARKVYSLSLLEMPVLGFTIFLLALAFVSSDKSNAFIYFQF